MDRLYIYTHVHSRDVKLIAKEERKEKKRETKIQNNGGFFLVAHSLLRRLLHQRPRLRQRRHGESGGGCGPIPDGAQRAAAGGGGASSDVEHDPGAVREGLRGAAARRLRAGALAGVRLRGEHFLGAGAAVEGPRRGGEVGGRAVELPLRHQLVRRGRRLHALHADGVADDGGDWLRQDHLPGWGHLHRLRVLPAGKLHRSPALLIDSKQFLVCCIYMYLLFVRDHVVVGCEYV